MSHIDYDIETDCFLNIKNKYFAFLETFFKFWRETITPDNEQEYELQELTQIFKSYCKTNKSRATTNNIYKILNYYYPNVEVTDDKNILNISCNLWNKNSEIEIFLSFYKNQMLTKNNEYKVSFYDVYNEYCNLCHKNGDFVANKKYFEKYIIQHIDDVHIQDDCFILSTWWS